MERMKGWGVIMLRNSLCKIPEISQLCKLMRFKLVMVSKCMFVFIQHVIRIKFKLNSNKSNLLLVHCYFKMIWHFAFHKTWWGHCVHHKFSVSVFFTKCLWTGSQPSWISGTIFKLSNTCLRPLGCSKTHETLHPSLKLIIK